MVSLWRVPDDHPVGMIGEYQRSVSPDRFLFRKGEGLPADVGVPVVRINAESEDIRIYDCLPNNAMVPLVGPRLGSFLMQCSPGDVQLVNARVLARNGEVEGFSFLNVTSKVFCIDHVESEYSFVPGTAQIMSFRKLRYLSGCLGSHRIARDCEYLSHILVCDELAKMLGENGFSGVSLQAADRVSW